MKKLLIEIVLKSGVIEPAEIKKIIDKISKLVVPEVYGDRLVIISGRLPVWLYSALTHYFHPFIAVATFDPRLSKAIVTSSHLKELAVGDIISVDDAEKLVVEY